MKNLNRISLYTLALFCIARYGSADELKNSQVTFEAIGKPSFIKIKGEGAKLSHTFRKATDKKDKNADVFEFDLTTLKTGIDMRDQHMKEKYLNVKEFPIATLTLPVESASSLSVAGTQKLTGTLTLHGQTKPVTVESERKGQKVTANFEIKLSDYGIDIPQWSGISVADLVKVRTQFEAVVKAAELAR